MIVVLLLILFTNCAYSYKKSNTVLSAPFINAAGFSLATLISLSFYNEWRLDKTTILTPFVIGIGVTTFTLTSIYFTRDKSIKQVITSRPLIKQHNYTILLLITAIIQIIIAYSKIHIYKQHFGTNNSISELLFAFRLSYLFENEHIIPTWLYHTEQITSNAILFFACTGAILAVQKKITKKIITLSIINLLLRYICCIFDGARGNLIFTTIPIIIIFYLKYNTYIQNTKIKKPSKLAILFLFLLICIVFITSSSWIGRESSNSNYYTFAMYMAAPLKNLDIYLHYPYFSNFFSESTLNELWQQIGKFFSIKAKSVVMSFNEIGNNSLGNVKTAYYKYYMDDGILGVIFFVFTSALIISKLHNQAIKSNSKSFKANIYEILYAKSIAFISITFFDDIFYNNFFSIFLIQTICYIIILSILFNLLIYE